MPTYPGVVRLIACSIFLVWGSGLSAAPDVVSEPLARYGFGSLNAAALSPDGRLLATAGNGDIVLWDTLTSTALRPIPGPGFTVDSLAFSPDGARLAGSGAQSTFAHVWDLKTGSVSLTLSGSSHGIACVAFSPDGARIATGGYDFSVRVWDAGTGQVLRTLWGASANRAVAFSPDGAMLLSGEENGDVRVWNPATGAMLRTFSAHPNTILSIAFSPGGDKFLTAGNETCTRVWDTATGQMLRTFWGFGSSVRHASFSPDGARIATASASGAVMIWDLTSDLKRQVLYEHTGPAFYAAFTPDGKRLWTAGEDNTLRQWDFHENVFSLRKLPAYPHAVSADWTKALTREAYDWTVSNLQTGDLITTLRVESGNWTVSAAAFTPDGNGLLMRWMHGAVLYSTQTGNPIRSFPEAGDPGMGFYRTIAFSRDGKQVWMARHEGDVLLWDVETGVKLREYSGEGVSAFLYSLAVSPDGTRLVVGTRTGLLYVWNAASGALIKSFLAYPWSNWDWESQILDVAYSPDGTKILTCGLNGYARLWDAATLEPVLTFRTLAESPQGVAFSPDGGRVLVGSGSGAALFDAQTGHQIYDFIGFTPEASWISFSPDGTEFQAGATICHLEGGLLDPQAGYTRSLASLDGCTRPVARAELSPDGKKAWIQDPQGKETLLSMESGRPVPAFSQANSRLAAFSPDSASLLLNTADGALVFYDAVTGLRTREFPQKPGLLDSMRFSRDGTKVLTVVSETARVWDARTGDLTRAFTARSIALSPDGTRVLTGGSDTTAKTWDLDTGQVLNVFWHPEAVNFVAFSQDGAHVLTGSGADSLATSWVWDVTTAQLTRGFPGEPIAVSPATERVLTRTIGAIVCWDAGTGQQLRSFPDTPFTLSRDWRHFLTSDGYRKVISWDLRTGGILRVFERHTSTVTQVALSSDGARALTAGEDGMVFLWDTGPPPVGYAGARRQWVLYE